MTLPKNEKPRSKPEKKLKPVRAWAVIGENGKIDPSFDVFAKLAEAKSSMSAFKGIRVVRVLITELD